MSEKVFVYGTLRVGDTRHGVSTFLRVLAPEAYVKGFYMLDLGGFPGLRELGRDGIEEFPKIRGELHEYENLGVLDRIEGYRPGSPGMSLYIRQLVDVETPEGIEKDCWVYTFHSGFPRGKVPLVGSGDWFEHRGYYERGNT